MPDRPGIPATLLLPADLLATLSRPADAKLLERVEKLLGEVRGRLDADARIMVDGREASRLCGICEKTLRDSDCPRVRLGASVRFRVEAIKQWAAEREVGPASGPRMRATA